MEAAAAIRLGPVPTWRADAMPSDAELKVRAETVIGPLHGFFLACYVIEAASGFHGYAKVHVHRPACAWGTSLALAKYTAGPCETSQLALHAVIATATVELAKRDTRANRAVRYVLKFL